MAGKRQHYTSCFHLRHFIGDVQKGCLWTYDAETGSARPSVPEDTGLETHYYSFENDDGTMSYLYDDCITEVEGFAAPIYKKLVEKQIPHEQEKFDFAFFLGLTYLRTPAMRRMTGEMRSRYIQIINYAYAIHDPAFEGLVKGFEKAEGKRLSDEQKTQLKQDFIDPSPYKIAIPKHTTFPDFETIEKLARILYDMNWSLIYPKHGYFITSDNPVVRRVDPKTVSPIYGDHGFLNKTVEVSFPLAPKIMLIAAWHENYPQHGIAERIMLSGIMQTVRFIRNDTYTGTFSTKASSGWLRSSKMRVSV